MPHQNPYKYSSVSSSGSMQEVCQQCKQKSCCCPLSEPNLPKSQSLFTQFPLTLMMFLIGYFMAGFLMEVLDSAFEHTTGTSYSESYIKWSLTGEFGFLVSITMFVQSIIERLGFTFLMMFGLILKDIGVVRGSNSTTSNSSKDSQQSFPVLPASSQPEPSCRSEIFHEESPNMRGRSKRNRSHARSDSRGRKKRGKSRKKGRNSFYRHSSSRQRSSYNEVSSEDEGNRYQKPPNNCHRCARRRARKLAQRQQLKQQRCSKIPSLSKGMRSQYWKHDEDSPIVIDDLDDVDIVDDDSTASLEQARWYDQCSRKCPRNSKRYFHPHYCRE